MAPIAELTSFLLAHQRASPDSDVRPRILCETHVVLTLDTLRLATDFQQSITLAPMNTGNTRPYAHRRGLLTFSRMSEYPFGKRLRRPLYYTVVELAVEAGVRNIMDYVIEAAEMRCSTCEKAKLQGIQLVKILYP